MNQNNKPYHNFINIIMKAVEKTAPMSRQLLDEEIFGLFENRNTINDKCKAVQLWHRTRYLGENN